MTWNEKVKAKLANNPTGLSALQIYKCRKCKEPTVFKFRICANCKP